ncbi:MAG TPA: ABC transporter substrate-binding protein [Fimbriimonadaceae bacterium]|nr:ABC transporter substrate-binding protein [Fimbriimonadaceae bacterium]
MKTRLFYGALAGVLLFGMIGCNGGSDSGAGGQTSTTGKEASAVNIHDANGYKIGLVASLNGAQKPWGDDCRKGAELAAEEFVQNGGVGDGKGIDLMVEDDNSSPEQGKSAAEKLISEGAIGLDGEVASGITMQMEQAAEPKGVPVVAVGATRTDLTKGHDNIFRVCYTDAFQGPVMAKFAYDQLHLRNVALMTDRKQPYSTGLSDAFRAYFTKLGGKIVDEEFYETGQTDFRGILTNVKGKNPDGLFMSGYFPETGPLARQAKESGLDVKMLGGDGWDSAQILQTGGDAIVGQFFCNHYNNNEQRPEVQEFLRKWKAKYGGLPGTTMGALGYDAMALTLDALKRAKTKDSKGLLEAIADTEGFKGVSGVITLKGMHGNPPKRALVVQLQNDPNNPQVFAKAYDMDPKTGEPVDAKP